VAAHGYRGLLKVSLLGPVTLAASLDQALGEVALSDAGLRRDLAESLAEGVRALLADVVARVPDAMPVLQLDEPLLPAVLNGAVRTRSGWGRLDPLDPAEAQTMLAEVLAAGTSARVVHCCAPDIPVQLLLAAGADAVSFDLDLVRDAHLDAYAQAVDAGTHLIVGAVPTSRAISGAETAERVATFWNRLGFSVGTMRERTIVSPSCGMAGLTGDASRAASAVAVQAAQRLAEQDSVAPAG
jgi:methionine synthase II (cobalamin-independent)